MEESDGERAAGTDTAEELAIRAMPIVTALSYVRAVKDKTRGVRVTLTCYNCREYGSCEKPQEAPIHLLKERSTMRVCLQELIKRLEENHGNYTEALAKKAAADAASAATVDPDVPNVLQAMMKLEQAKKEWLMEHVNTPINESVVMYQSAEQIIRPPAPSDVSVCKGIMSCFSFLLCEGEDLDPSRVAHISW